MLPKHLEIEDYFRLLDLITILLKKNRNEQRSRKFEIHSQTRMD